MCRTRAGLTLATLAEGALATLVEGALATLVEGALATLATPRGMRMAAICVDNEERSDSLRHWILVEYFLFQAAQGRDRGILKREPRMYFIFAWAASMPGY